MRRRNVLWPTAVLWMIAVLTASFPVIAAGEDATGKVVFVDTRNSALLLEAAKGGGGIPGAKEGETFTFIVPAELQGAAGGLAPGDAVAVTFEEKEGKDGPRTLKSVTKK